MPAPKSREVSHLCWLGVDGRKVWYAVKNGAQDQPVIYVLGLHYQSLKCNVSDYLKGIWGEECRVEFLY